MPKPKKLTQAQRRINDANVLFGIHLDELRIPFEREFQFDEHRKWRADFALLVSAKAGGDKVLVEIEGAISKYAKFHPEWTQGRHQRSEGMIADMEKYNYAALLGYRVLRFTTEQISTGEAQAFVKRYLDD